VPIKIRLVAPPLYVISTTSTDKTAALESMEKAVEAIGDKIKEEGGDMVIKMSVSFTFMPSF
jgi:translation initiation factor 2 subunit 1